MKTLQNSQIVRRIPLLIAVCLVSIPAQAKYGGGTIASAGTSTYVFLRDQSAVVQTGGIAYVHRTYSIKGQFQLTVDPNAGTASFAHVDANATDDSPFKRTLDLNHVFNMTSLIGTVEPSGSIKFTGKAADDSDILITATFQDNLVHLIGQTTPPPHSADFFIFSLDAVAQLRKYAGGSGMAEDPYQIATAEDLITLGETPKDYDKHFILTDDIDLDPNIPGGHVFDKALIAPDTDSNDKFSWFQGTPFTGVFDGNDHAISHLTITGHGYLGLFGQLRQWGAPGGEVKDLDVLDVNIAGSDNCVGGLVGCNLGTLTHCYSTGAVSAIGSYIGGLVGYNTSWNSVVTHCHTSGEVRGGSWVGGLVGVNEYGAVIRCYSTGSVVGIKGHIGGLIGANYGNVTDCYSTSAVSGANIIGGLVGVNGYSAAVADCYSTGAVSGEYIVGGLVGFNGYSAAVADCYSTGAVSGTGGSVGGLVGVSDYLSEVTASFWDIQTSGQTKSAAGASKITAEIQTAKTFLEAGWDFVNIWGIGENQTYPYLRKYSAADINQDASVNFLDLAALAENWLTSVAP